ncbi:MAG: MtrB/PioB family decaheme-associated outer membrane protein, partial [Burkholderiaceae bacterium]|nr:MtrB/PioB family decaheme-associated outer membrane protein [Burkholderiaceae bacterium]
MRIPVRHFSPRPTLVAVALLAAFGPAHGQSAEAKPAEETTRSAQASVSAGGAWVSGNSADRAFFGQYNGMREQSVYGLLDVDYRRADAADGTSLGLVGTNLGLQTRELLLYWQKQGDWRVAADYGELIRREPYTVNTGLVGAGSTTPQVVHLTGGTGSGSDFDPKTKRRGVGLGFAKWLGPALEFTADLKSENKDGSRIFGIGMTCPSTVAVRCGPTTTANAGSAVLLLPEPIDANHSQAELRLNYAGDRLRLTGGYYGSFYSNSNNTLNPGIPGVLNNPLGTPLPLSNGLQAILANPVALPPENRSQTLDLAGNYAFTPTTRANFKVAYSQARQDQDFAGSGLAGAPAGVASLDGEVNTTLAQVGLVSRPIARLTLLAEGRYEDRNDKTPIAAFNTEGTASWTNRDYSLQRIRGKLQATYQFAGAYLGTVGVDYDAIERADFTPSSAALGVSALRQDTDETTWRVELRRRMSESFSGEIRFSSSDRNGSNWLRPTSGGGVTEVTDPSTFPATAIFAPTLADRRRDQLKVQANWQPTDALMLVASAAGGSRLRVVERQRLRLLRHAEAEPGAAGGRDPGVRQHQHDGRPRPHRSRQRGDRRGRQLRLRARQQRLRTDARSAGQPVERSPARRHRRPAGHQVPADRAAPVRPLRTGQEPGPAARRDLPADQVRRLGLRLRHRAVHLRRQH